MTAINDYIHSLENYIERGGARLIRTNLPEWVHGRTCSNLITLRAGLSPEMELPALVHEMTHWLAHRNLRCGFNCTVFEYEAEAVEALVMGRLRLAQPAGTPSGCAGTPGGCGDPSGETPTDGLLAASVARVVWASGRICAALGLEQRPGESEAKSPVHFEASAGKEIVRENESHRLGDFIGLAQAL